MKDFKIGDRVRDVSVTRRFGTITSVNHYGDPDCLVVLFDDDEEGVCYVKDLEIFPDPKTAFLTEMQSLLRKYDAKIHVWAGDDGDKVLIFELKDNIDICYPNEWLNDYKFEFPITPDNIFNYDKE